MINYWLTPHSKPFCPKKKLVKKNSSSGSRTGPGFSFGSKNQIQLLVTETKIKAFKQPNWSNAENTGRG
jgi:hypothetical protein